MKFVLPWVVALALPGILAAEEAPAPAEIVVTATKQPTDERVLTVPVTVIDPSTSDATDLGGLLSEAPGINVQTQTPGQPVLAAESFGSNAFADVNFLLDGASLNRPDMAGTSLGGVPLLAVDHVEILNGPASALYGDQSLAGAVNVVTKTPVKPMFGALGSMDENGGSDLSLLAGIPFSVPGGFLLAVDRDQVIPTRAGSQSLNWSLWSKLTVGPLAQQTFTLTDSYSHDATQLPGSLNGSEVAKNPNQIESANGNDHSTTVLAQVSGKWDYATDGFSSSVPVSFGYRDINAYYPSGGYSMDYKLYQTESEPNARRVFPGVAGGDLTTALAVGGSYQELDVWSYSDANETVLSVAPKIQRYDGHSWASVQQDWGPWVATGVVRYEFDTTVASAPGQTVKNSQQTFQAWTSTLGGAWLPDPGSKVAVNLGTVFRYPLTDEMVSYYGTPITVNASLKPVTGSTAELSGSTTWTVIVLALRGSVTAMTNEIGYNTATSTNVNLDPTLHWVADADLSTKPVALGFVPGTTSAGAEYTFTEALFTWGPNQGDQVPLVPLHRVRLSAGYRPVESLTISGHGTMTSGYFLDGDVANVYPQISGRAVVDADVTLNPPTLPQWTFTVYGHNLTNDQTSDDAIAPTSYSQAAYYPTSGRTFGASVKAVF